MKKRKLTTDQRSQILSNNINKLFGNVLTASQKMGVKRATIYNWISSGRIPKMTLDALAWRGVDIRKLMRGL